VGRPKLRWVENKENDARVNNLKCRSRPLEGRRIKEYVRTIRTYSQEVRGYVVAQLVEALCYKLESRWFDSQWSHWNLSVT
jgi:hypothetical protein